MKIIKAIIYIALTVLMLFMFPKSISGKEFNQDDMKILNMYMSYNSDEILQLIKQNGLQIKRLDDTNNNITGLYTGNEILLKDGYIQKSLNHEIGHFVDDYYKYSQNQEFINAYNQEKHNLRDYYQNDIEEYFAECYKMYVENWPALNNYPLTKQFFEENISKNQNQENFIIL